MKYAQAIIVAAAAAATLVSAAPATTSTTATPPDASSSAVAHPNSKPDTASTNTTPSGTVPNSSHKGSRGHGQRRTSSRPHRHQGQRKFGTGHGGHNPSHGGRSGNQGTSRGNHATTHQTPKLTSSSEIKLAAGSPAAVSTKPEKRGFEESESLRAREILDVFERSLDQLEEIEELAARGKLGRLLGKLRRKGRKEEGATAGVNILSTVQGMQQSQPPQEARDFDEDLEMRDFEFELEELD